MCTKYVFVLLLSIWIKSIRTLQTTPYDSTHERSWSTWYDTDTPRSDQGDDETVASIRKRGYEVCDGHSPIDAMCRLSDNHMLVFNSENTRFVPNTLFVSCTTHGLQCRNTDQSTTCKNYEIRFECLSPKGGKAPENLGVIGAAAGLSVIVPIFCVAMMHLVRYIRDRRRPASQNLVENTEQSVQTETSDLPPSYSVLFGTPDTSTPSSPTGLSNRLSLTDSSGGLSVPYSSLSSSSINITEEQQRDNRSVTGSGVNELPTTSSNWRSRFPNMHLSILDLFNSLGQRSPSLSPQSPDLSYIQTPPPSYKDAVIIIGGQTTRDENEKPDS